MATLLSAEKYFKYSNITPAALFCCKSSSKLIDCLNELKDKVPKYIKVVDERYDYLHHKCKWDVVEFFQNPEKFARHPGHTLIEDNLSADFWVKEYEKNKEREAELRYTLKNKEERLNYKKCAYKIKKEVQGHINEIEHLLIKAEHKLPWYHFESTGLDKLIAEPILSKNEEYLDEDSIKKDEILLLVQQYETAFSLEMCLSMIQNKDYLIQKANEEQYEKEKEAAEWFRTHPDWFDSIVIGVVTKQFNNPDLGNVACLYR